MVKTSASKSKVVIGLVPSKTKPISKPDKAEYNCDDQSSEEECEKCGIGYTNYDHNLHAKCFNEQAYCADIHQKAPEYEISDVASNSSNFVYESEEQSVASEKDSEESLNEQPCPEKRIYICDSNNSDQNESMDEDSQDRNNESDEEHNSEHFHQKHEANCYGGGVGELRGIYGVGYDFCQNDIDELACQGVKPWDSDAEDVLDILNGGYESY